MAAQILDPCCGSRMFYFDKANPNVLFCDCREVDVELCDGRRLEVRPDMLVDVAAMPFEDDSFPLVVFDPPHLTIGNGWQVQKYGKLPKDWKNWMTSAFAECWRVLRPEGTLVFKWYEYTIPLSEVLECAPCAPVLGNRKPRQSKTHWLVFFKRGDRDER